MACGAPSQNYLDRLNSRPPDTCFSARLQFQERERTRDFLINQACPKNGRALWLLRSMHLSRVEPNISHNPWGLKK